MSITDIKGNITSANDRFCEVSGYTRQELLGQNHRIVKSDKHPPEFFREMWLTISKGDTWNGEMKNKAKDGSAYWVDATIVPFKDPDGKITQYVAVRTDISRVKFAEQRLKKANNDIATRTEELEKKHAELIKLNKSLKEAETTALSAAQAKSEFLANMSHEIRTPLNGILGFADLLRGNADASSESERQDWLNTIHNSGQHLLRLVNNILDLSKIEAGQMEVERIPCSPHLIVSEAVSVLRPRAKEKGIALELNFDGQLPAMIESDPTRLKQMLMNIVGNAIKFTNEGGVHVVARIINTGDKPMFAVDVIDTGVGIPKRRLDAIFAPFVQADNSMSRKFGGTGLGLAISKRIAHALGGKLSVCSDEGGGSTFTFVVETGSLEGVELIDGQAAEALIHREPSPVVNQNPTLKGRVLIVDDGDTNRRLISLVLDRAGIETANAENGQTAVEMATTDSFDAILMDVQMPIMDGYTATKTLRKRGVKIPIIALTANAMKGEEDKCLKAGFSEYLTKPIVTGQLMKTLSEALSNRAGSEMPPPPEDHSVIPSTLPTDDPDFREIVEEFVERLSQQIEAIQRAREADDLDEVARLAHWLRGAGGMAGYSVFTDPAARLELLANEGKLEQFESLIDDLVDLAGRVVVDSADACQETSP